MTGPSFLSLDAGVDECALISAFSGTIFEVDVDSVAPLSLALVTGLFSFGGVDETSGDGWINKETV